MNDNPIQSDLHAETLPDPTPCYAGQKESISPHTAGVTSVQIHRISLAELREQRDMIAAHWAEVRGKLGGTVKLDPDWDVIESMHPTIAGVFDASGQMVGYGLAYVRTSTHSRSTPVLQVDAIYLQPAHRSLGIAARLLAELRRLDPSLPVMAHATVGSAAEAFLVRQGFRELERLFLLQDH